MIGWSLGPACVQSFEPTDEPNFDPVGAPTGAPAVHRQLTIRLGGWSYPGGLFPKPNSSFLLTLSLAFEAADLAITDHE